MWVCRQWKEGCIFQACGCCQSGAIFKQWWKVVVEAVVERCNPVLNQVRRAADFSSVWLYESVLCTAHHAGGLVQEVLLRAKDIADPYTHNVWHLPCTVRLDILILCCVLHIMTSWLCAVCPVLHIIRRAGARSATQSHGRCRPTDPNRHCHQIMLAAVAAAAASAAAVPPTAPAAAPQVCLGSNIWSCPFFYGKHNNALRLSSDDM